MAAWRASPYVRARVVETLAARLDSEVTLESFHVSFWPQPSFVGRGLVIRYHGRTDIPPFVAVRQFSGTTDLSGVLRRRAREVHLEGLEIAVPPQRRDDLPDMRTDGPTDGRGGRTFIDRLVSEDARLSILSKDPAKHPKVFDIFTLEMRDVGLAAPAAFTASLTNPIPFGAVDATGSFGPWRREAPSLTPLEGEYAFKADLGTIRGVAGSLDSVGTFGGVLKRIDATGLATIPDFSLSSVRAAALPLETRFDAVIDGTSGDVFLTTVEARLGASAFTTSGAIVGVEGVRGKRVTLDVQGAGARVEDFMRLVVDERSPLFGSMRFKARLDLRPGDEDVLEKLWLNGDFALKDAHFASRAVQDKVDELSRRGRGTPTAESVDDVVSDVKGEFALKDGVLTIPVVTFGVTGAQVRMAGTYRLRAGTLDFRGDVQLEAPASKMVTGVKSWLLRPFDSFFREPGVGTRVAIKVGGTKADPKFGIEIGRTLRGK